ncbi:hypothetical protein ZOSMA_77G00450 [Zostera marina]|uniref:Uncharacterized protein n=1 Tax=Zostera marina TaxID=29655 RepID=A0A0K9NNP4_ZOSMR|nr:hypothetical protein ZOSMA_77G00450 [Zostera marina]
MEEEEEKTERTVSGILSDLAETTISHNLSQDTDSVDFTPVVHPVEPSGDGDRPVDCPISDTSLFQFFEDGKWGNEEEMLGINPKKRVEICRDDNNDNDKNSREQQQRRLHKRHQSQKGTPGNVNIFHIFNQCKT